MKKIIGIIVVLMSLLLLIGCTSTTPVKTASAPAPAEPAVKQAVTSPPAQVSEPAVKAAATGGELRQVVIENFKFVPATLEIKVGDSVEWTNKDSAPHTISIPALNVDQKLAKGETFTQKFTQKADFGYHCTFHPSMQATVIVN